MPTRDELIADIRRMADRLDRTPRAVDVLHASDYRRAAFREEFGTWRMAVREALDRPAPEPGPGELLGRIMELHAEVEPNPSIQTWHEETLYAPRAIYECEAFDGWTDAKTRAGILVGFRNLIPEEG